VFPQRAVMALFKATLKIAMTKAQAKRAPTRVNYLFAVMALRILRRGKNATMGMKTKPTVV
jgi:23S rRNA maturation mini-RNase III